MAVTFRDLLASVRVEPAVGRTGATLPAMSGMLCA
jgi:hypothetical protein